MKYLVALDILSDKRFYLHLNARDKLQSLPGLCITLLLLISLIPLIYFFGENYFKKINPVVSFDQKTTENLTDIFFSKYIVEWSENIFDDIKFISKANWAEYQCSDDDFKHFSISKNNSYGYLCFNTTQFWDRVIIASDGTRQFIFSFTRDTTLTVEDYVVINMYTDNINYNIKNTNIFQEKQVVKINLFHSKLKDLGQIKSYFYYQNIRSEDDIGSFFKEYKYDQNFVFDIRTLSLLNDYFYVLIEITTNPKSIIYKRRFMKLPEVISTVTSVFNLVLMVLRIINNLYLKIKMKYIMSRLLLNHVRKSEPIKVESFRRYHEEAKRIFSVENFFSFALRGQSEEGSANYDNINSDVNLKKGFLNTFIFLDMLSNKRFHLYHNGNDKLQSLHGGFLTMILLIGLIPMIYFFGENYFNKINPTTSYDEKGIFFSTVNENITRKYLIEINKEVLDGLGVFIQVTEFINEISVINYYKYSWEDYVCKDEYLGYFSIIADKLNQYLCFNTTQFINSALFTYHGQTHVTVIYFYLIDCRHFKKLKGEESKGFKCVEKDLNNETKIGMSTYFEDMGYDLTATDLFQNKIGKYTINYKLNDKNNRGVIFTNQYMVSADDIGFWSKEYQYTSGCVIYSISTSASNLSSYQLSLAVVTYSNKTVITYQRKFMKLPEVLTSVFFVFNLFRVVIKIIYNLYLQRKTKYIMSRLLLDLFSTKSCGNSSNSRKIKSEQIFSVENIFKISTKKISNNDENLNPYMGFKKRFLNTIVFLDLISDTRFYFYHKGSDKLQSLLGVFLTMILFMCLVPMIYFFGENYFKMINPTISFNQRGISSSNLNENINWKYLIEITKLALDGVGIQIFVNELINGSSILNTFKHSWEEHVCSDDDLKYFSIIKDRFNEYLCFDSTQFQNSSFIKAQENHRIEFYIQFSDCIALKNLDGKESEFFKCVEKFINTEILISMNLYFQDMTYDLSATSFFQPKIVKWNIFNDKLNYKINPYNELYFGCVRVEDDISPMFIDYKNYTNLKFTLNRIGYINLSAQFRSWIHILTDNVVKIYTRRFMKIQEVVALVSSVFKIFVIIFSGIYETYLNRKMKYIMSMILIRNLSDKSSKPLISCNEEIRKIFSMETICKLEESNNFNNYLI
jgi:hypothetical protein